MTNLGADYMTFFKEGKKFKYEEVVKMLNTLIGEKIILHLEEEELCRFFTRLFDFSSELIEDYLAKLDYKVVNARQSYHTLEKLKKVSEVGIWEKGIDIYEAIKAGKPNKDDVIRYMTDELYGAMKELNSNL